MSSNYPPGVSGREPHITGEYRCRNCNTVLPEEVDCADCGGSGVTAPDEFGNRDPCPRCESAREQLREGECPGGCYEPDPDELAEAQREQRADYLNGRDEW